MSTGEFIRAIPSRFREERERLGYSRPELAEALDVSSDTVKNWEGRTSSPNAVDLAKFHEIGADVLYILTGRKSVLNGVAQDQATYGSSMAMPHVVKLAAIAAKLSVSDAELVLLLARRLDSKKT